MKRSLLLGAVSAMAMIASAQAADLGGAKETVYTPPPYNWAGFYVGVNGGYAWNEGGVSVSPVEALNCNGSWCGWENRAQKSLEGGFGGGQIGFNLQRDRLVYGLEADIQGAGINGSATAVPDSYGFGSAHSNAELDWFGTFRGRLGLIPYQNWLVYMTAGVAFGGIQDSLGQNFNPYSVYNHNLSGSVSRDDVYAGYVLGAGVEYGFGPAWSVKFEYQFMDLGVTRLHETASWCNCTYISSDLESKLSFNTVRVGINYHLVPQYVPLK